VALTFADTHVWWKRRNNCNNCGYA